MNKVQNDITRYSVYKMMIEEAKGLSSESLSILEFFVKLLYRLEEMIIEDQEYANNFVINKTILENMEISENDFLKIINRKSRSVNKYMKLWAEVRILSETHHKKSFAKLVKIIIVMSEQFIGKDLFVTSFSNLNILDKTSSKGNLVFLSYAYTDKLYTIGLFLFFEKRGILLFIDWMNNPEHLSGYELKVSLNKALTKCEQLLFLRSVNSELSIRGSSQIRQWCSWEIGNYYCKRPSEKFYTAIYEDKVNPNYKRNLMLSTFAPLNDIQSGKMI